MGWSQQPAIENLGDINTKESEFSPAFYGDELVFVHQPLNGKVDPQTNQVFYELYRATQRPNGRKKARPFSIELNSSYHEGPISFSRDQQQIFFTRTNMKRGVSQSDGKGRAGLKVYYAYQGPYEWLGTKELSFNSDEYSCMHPTLSADGQRLFFVSDRPGGFGGLDLYLSEWKDGAWGTPINLGPEVNTSKNEAFPFIHDSGQLFFSSNGHQGHGGLDVFVIDLSGRSWGKVYNLPKPFNSEADDFGLILNSDASFGYLSSDRPGGRGKDDLYRFTSPHGLEDFTGNPAHRELLTVYDAGASRRILGAEVWLTEITEPGGNASEPDIIPASDGSLRLRANQKAPPTGNTQVLRTDGEGHADLLLREGKAYRILIFQPGFAPGEIRFDYRSNGPSRPLEVALQPANCTVVSGSLLDRNNGSAINGAKIRFFPVNCQDIPSPSAVSGQDGQYYACIPVGCDWQLVVEHPLYEEYRTGLRTDGSPGHLADQNFSLMMLNGSAEVEVLRTGSVIILENIAYEDDRYALEPGRNGDLDLLLALLKEKSGLRVVLENHTETNGPSEYNQDLSLRRVEAIREYLVARGITPDRLQLSAHGESVPRNHCGDNENCSTNEHLANRRTEVRVLSMGS